MSWFCSEDFSSVVFSSPLCLPFSVTLGFPELPLPPVPVACVPLPGGAVRGGMAGRGLGSDRSGEDVRPAPCAPPVLPPCPPCAWHLGLSPAGSRERPPCHQPPRFGLLCLAASSLTSCTCCCHHCCFLCHGFIKRNSCDACVFFNQKSHVAILK